MRKTYSLKEYMAQLTEDEVSHLANYTAQMMDGDVKNQIQEDMALAELKEYRFSLFMRLGRDNDRRQDHLALLVECNLQDDNVRWSTEQVTVYENNDAFILYKTIATLEHCALPCMQN